MSVGFLSSTEISLVLHEPALTPFRKNKKTKKVLCNEAYFISVFSDFSITVDVYDASSYMKMIYVCFIVHQTFHIINNCG